MSEYESRLDEELQSILQTQTHAALGSLQGEGWPYVSMVPFAVEPTTGRIVLHVSTGAPHTEHMQADARVSLLVAAPEQAQAPDGSRPRVTIQARARFPEPGQEDWVVCRSAYLSRFPQSESLTAMLDYAFVVLTLVQARQVSGFGAARSVSESSLMPLLAED